MPLPPPPEERESPRDRLARLEAVVGTREAALLCADLLASADPTDHPQMLRWLGDASGRAILEGSPSWLPYWGNVWGARGLLYVWDDDATPAVLGGLGHEAWRVAEMCLKVSAHRDLPAGDDAVRLARHELPR
ncbi:MAG: hypothetical protein WBQ50_01335, partial [Nocardioides sp.]